MLDQKEIILLTRNSIASKAACNEVLQNFQPFIANLDAKDACSLLAKRGEDTLSKSLLPDDFKGFVPLRSTGDGNCLFNSTSIVLHGNEKLAGILRLLVACELLAHSEFYADHPQLNEMTHTEGTYTLNNLIVVLLSDERALKVYNGKADTVPEAISVLAREVSRPWVYASPYHVMALSSVIGRPVYSVYPDLESRSRVRRSIHRKFLPRQMLLSEDDRFPMPPPIHIMWTTVSSEDLTTWKPNHFVPLVPLEEQSFGKHRVSLSYADAVKGHITDATAKRNQDKATGVQKGKMSPFKESKKVAEKEKETSDGKGERAKKRNETHLKVMPEKDQPSIAKQRNAASKPVQQKKFAKSSPYGKSEKEEKEEKDNRKDKKGKSVPLNRMTDAKQEKKPQCPQSTVQPNKAQPKIVKPINVPNKLVQQNRVTESSPFQIGETVWPEKSAELRGDGTNVAEVAASPKKAPEGKDNRKDKKGKAVPPNRMTDAKKRNKPQSTAPLEKDKLPHKKGEEYSLASELWQLKRKSSQCQQQPSSKKKMKGHFDPSLPRITVEKKANLAKNKVEETHANENTYEALDKATNSDDLGTYLYGLNYSSNKKPKRKYLSKKKPMSTTLAFDFSAYCDDKNNESSESNASRLVSPSIQGYFSPENSKESAKPFADKPSLPLATSAEWYSKQGELSKANAARSEKRRSCQTGELVVKEETFSFLLGSQTKESLSDSISRLEKKVHGVDGKEKARLTGILEVARSLRDSFPLMKTQKAGQMYKEKISESYELQKENDSKIVRTSSSEIYTILSKHLNIMHLKIKGTGFIMESKDEGPFREFFKQMTDLLQTANFQTSLNRHIENEIGKTYKTLLNYMDTERDKSAMKYILSRITSVKFASKLQDTSNKESIRRSRDLIPYHLQRFSELRETIRKEIGARNLSKRQECYLMKRTLEAEKIKQIRIRNSERTGRKLKVEEFPDLVAILEYEFGEGDHRERGGGGLESHSKLRKELLYRASNNKTKMKDAREAILALAPDDFTIALSTCFNYTQNFRKGTLEARRHHEGRGVNACLSLHKAPDTAPIKDKVINIHWTSSNVNYVLDKASKEPNIYCVDSRDAKQVIRANTGHGGRTWRNIQNPDHTFDTSRTNAVTPMTHLLVETIETKRNLTLNNNPKLQELFLSPSPRSEVVVHIKRTGKAITFLNLSHYEPETIFRSVNEFLYMITLPALDACFRNPETGQFKETLVSIVDNGIEKPRSPLVKMLLVRLRRLLGLKAVVHVSFAEYHSKRNPVERVHAVHTKELEKHGPFQIANVKVDSVEHKRKMEEMREDVEDVLRQAKFGGKSWPEISDISERKHRAAYTKGSYIPLEFTVRCGRIRQID